MDAVRSRLRIGRRFRGPPGAANGGFASGSLAARLGGTVDVEVSLRRPVPSERPLGARHDGDATLLLDNDGRLLAEAHPSGAEVELVAWLLGRDGRKLTAGSALLGPDGEVLAAARTLRVTAARTAGGSG